ncbi:MAG: response regulator transcription factor [Pirellulales bacterium]|nr:response regulator transcription factor [Pirellulales bacterium]
MAHESILVVEDESDIQELLRFNLAKDGYRVQCTDSGEEALRLARSSPPDLVLLDLMLPGMDGLEVCRKLKSDSRTQHIPILMLTAKGEETDIVTGLELGADDYMTKPFSPRVLTARIRTVLRRAATEPFDEQSPVKVHDLAIHPGRHEVLVSDVPVCLTRTEFRVLQYLASRPGWVFTRYQIADAIHDGDAMVTDRSIDVQIVGLRKKLGEAGRYIETVRGVGYRFKESR